MPIFDTDVLSLLRVGDASIIRRVAAVPSEMRYTTVISHYEMLRGAINSINEEHTRSSSSRTSRMVSLFANIADINSFFSSLIVLPYDDRAEAVFQAFPGEVKRGRANDCRIAAVAIAKGLPVATRNLRDFSKIPDVVVEEFR